MKEQVGMVVGTCENGQVTLSLLQQEYYSGSVLDARGLLEAMEPLMKRRSSFLYSAKRFTLRSHDAKDTVRVLRKILLG